MSRTLTLAWFLLGASLLACSRDTAPASSGTRGAPAMTAPAVPERKPFGAACVQGGECLGDVCFHKRLKGPDAGPERRGMADAVEPEGYCSLRCVDDADCPVPPTRGKCGARGMCKRLD